MDNHLNKGLIASFLIHGLICIGILLVKIWADKKCYAQVNKPIVIDFRIGNNFKQVEEQTLSQKKPQGVKKKGESKQEEKVLNQDLIPTIQEPATYTETLCEPLEEAVETGNITQEVSDNSDNVDEDIGGGYGEQKYLKEHFAYIKDRIRKEISYPPMAREMGWEGKVVVSFVVREDGYLEDIKVIEKSKYEIFVKNTINTIKKTSPFPKPSVKVELIIPVTYKLENN